MAKRSLSKIRIYDEWAGGTYIQCTLMQLNDYNLLDSIVVDGEYEYSSGLNIKSLNTDFALIHDDSTSSEDAWYTNLSDAVFKRYVSNTTNKTIGWWADYSPILNVQCRGGSLGNAQVYYAFVLDDELQLAWIVAYIIDGSNNSTIRIVRAHNLYQYFQMRMRPIIGGGATHIATKTGLLATLSEDVEAVAEGIEVGTYPMGLTKEAFTATSENFTTIEIEVEDGWLEILALPPTDEPTPPGGGGPTPGGGGGTPTPTPDDIGDVLGAKRGYEAVIDDAGQVLGANRRSPKTSDNNNAILWMMVMGSSALGMAAMMAQKKRKEEE